MPAATPRLYFQILFQHEGFRIISTEKAGTEYIGMYNICKYMHTELAMYSVT